MSEDHKPNRNDEMRRIKDAGGAVVNMGGIARVTNAAGAGAPVPGRVAILRRC
jgi:serine/threonine protein phosphatase PrpC